MTNRVSVLFHVFLVGFQAAALALDSSSTCAPGSSECVPPTPPTGDEEVSLSKLTLLQTKVAFDSEKKEELLSDSSERKKSESSAKSSSETQHRFSKHSHRTRQARNDPFGDPACAQCLQQFEQAATTAALAPGITKTGYKTQACDASGAATYCRGTIELTKLQIPLTPANGYEQMCSRCYHYWCAECGTLIDLFLDSPQDEVQAAIDLAAELRPTYQPGNVGHRWTKDEVLAVKGKLWRLFSVGEGADLYNDMPFPRGLENPDPNRDLLRLAPKVARLAFHDCHLYSDRTGGCDGCLQWEGIGDRFDVAHAKTGFWDENHGISHNNGLMPTVEMLEAIYIHRDWPKNTVVLPRSLYQSGISRADLWNLAGIAGVEYGIWTNNAVCEHPNWEAEDHGAAGLGFSSVPHCHHDDVLADMTSCKIDLNRDAQRIRFQYGRRDCIHTDPDDWGYKTNRPEVHLDAVEDGRATANFFSNQFNMNGRDAVAIMGIHTLGRIHYENAMLRYNWVKNGDGLFNNQYFRNLAHWKVRRFVGNSCDTVGDSNGDPAKVRWLTRVQNDNTEHGPYQFIKEVFSCQDECAKAEHVSFDCCLDQKRSLHGYIVGTCKNTTTCMKWRVGSVPWDDTIETMLGAEMGLYLDFTMGDHDLPTGNDLSECPGLGTFTFNKLEDNFTRYQWSGTEINNGDDFMKGPTGCIKQGYHSPSGAAQSLHEIVDEFAENQNAWLQSFAVAWEKMGSNGYHSHDLQYGPDQYTDIMCPAQDHRKIENRFWICYDTEAFGQPVMIVANDTADVQLVVEEEADLRGDLVLREPTGVHMPRNLRQVWYPTGHGSHYVNAATGGALVVEEQGSFNPSETYPGRYNSASGMALGRTCTGSNCGEPLVLTNTTLLELEDDPTLGHKWEMRILEAHTVEAIGEVHQTLPEWTATPISNRILFRPSAS